MRKIPQKVCYKFIRYKKIPANKRIFRAAGDGAEFLALKLLYLGL